MTTPKTLARPLAQRVAGLEQPVAGTGNESDIPDNVLQAATDALARGETHYTDRPGIPEFRTLVAELLGERFGLQIDPKEVTITCGSTEARFATMVLFAETGTQVMCPGNSARLKGAAHMVGVEIIDAAVDPTRVSVLYLTPDDDEQTVSKLLEQAVTHGWWVVWDMSYAARERDFHPCQQEGLASRTVTINTVSEHMPGWRIGWMAGSEAALRLRAFKQAITICTTNVSQWAALEHVRSETA